MKTLLCFIASLFALTAIAQGPILRTPFTVNTAPVVTNIVREIATNSTIHAGKLLPGGTLPALNGSALTGIVVEFARVATNVIPDSPLTNNLYMNTGQKTVDAQQRTLFDDQGTNKLNWKFGTLRDNSEAITLHWINKTFPLGWDGSTISNLNASQLTSGTIPDARFPAILPAIDGSQLTGLPGGGDVTTTQLNAASNQLFHVLVRTNDTRAIAMTGTLSVKGAGVGSERFGSNAVASGVSSLAVGPLATAHGNAAVAVGINATVDSIAHEGVALGGSSHVSALGGVALGPAAIVSMGSDFGVAIGDDAKVEENHVNSFAFGTLAITTEPNQIMLGTANYSVEIPGSIHGFVLVTNTTLANQSFYVDGNKFAQTNETGNWILGTNGNLSASGTVTAPTFSGNATTATTASAGDSATAFFPSGTLEETLLPTGINPNKLADGTVSSLEFIALDGGIDLSAGDATGTLAAGRFPALTGDVTTSAGSLATTIANDAVTYAKIQNVTDARLLGRSAGSSGDVQEITVGSGLSLSAGALTATGGSGGTNQYYPATDADQRIKLGGDNAYFQTFDTNGDRNSFLDENANLTITGNFQVRGGSVTITNQASPGNDNRIVVADEDGTITASSTQLGSLASTTANNTWTAKSLITGTNEVSGRVVLTVVSNLAVMDWTKAGLTFVTNNNVILTGNGDAGVGQRWELTISNSAASAITFTFPTH